MDRSKLRLPLLLFVLFFGSSCRTSVETNTIPTVAPIVNPTALPVDDLVTDTPLPPSPTAVVTPAEPTAEATPSPPAAPTAEPSVVVPSPTISAAAVQAITLIPILEGAFDRPLYVTHAGDERLFVVEQSGVIKLVRNGQVNNEPFLDIQDRVGSSGYEQGLLGLAFHPDYALNGSFFVDYTDLNGVSHISRFQVSTENPDKADPASEVILLTVSQPAPNHNGGQLEFGPDGYLYVGLGDGGGSYDRFQNGQNPNTILATILRFDVNQSNDSLTIPTTNPYVGDVAGSDEVWAWGLRNPWRFSFDRLNGDLYITDVGENLWEEVNFQPAGSAGGENYGWSIMEGSHCLQNEGCDPSGLQLPVFEYPHTEGCSITGGYVYRGTQFPGLFGNYFAADYCQGTIWGLFQNTPGIWSSTQVLSSNHIISSFGEDAGGELYILDHIAGSLYQIGQ